MKIITISALMLSLSICLAAEAVSITTFNQKTFEDNLKITGDFVGNQITAEKDLIVNGFITLAHSTIEGKTELTGELKATQTTFNGDIKITGILPKIEFTDSNAEKITVVTLPPLKKEAVPVEKTVVETEGKEKNKTKEEASVPGKLMTQKVTLRQKKEPKKEEIKVEPVKVEAAKTEGVKEELVVKQDPGIVTLNGNSQVEKIVFEGNPGIVVLKGTSKVEKVENGEFRS